MLRVSAFSSLHQFYRSWVQTTPRQLGARECWGWRSTETGDRLLGDQSHPAAWRRGSPEAHATYSMAILWGLCWKHSDAIVSKTNLRKKFSKPLDDMVKRIKKAAWTERTGNIIVCLHTRYPFSQVYLGKVVFYWWATFEPDTEVKKTKTKDTVSRQE